MDRKSKAFGHRLRRSRENAQLSLRACARAAQISATYLSKIERGELPPPAEPVIRILARLVREDPDEMVRVSGRVPATAKNLLGRDKLFSDLVAALQRMTPRQRKELIEHINHNVIVID
jgi:HTH-type transcriptional regulator, competence development regulator